MENFIYPKNDLWSVRQIKFLYDALSGYENKSCVFYTTKTVTTVISNIETYNYKGVIVFEGQDRTIILEQGNNYGLTTEQVINILKEKNITFEIK